MSMLWTTILTSVVCLLSFIVWIVAQRWRNHGRRLPPGLPAVPILGSLPFFKPSEKSLYLYFMDLSKRYGNIFSFKMRSRLTVVLNDYTLIREAFVHQSAIFAGRDLPDMPVERMKNPHMKGIVTPSYTESWQQDRNLTLTILQEFGFGKSIMQCRVLEECDQLVDHLAAQTDKDLDPRPLFITAVSNVICAITFGRRFHYDQCEELTSAVARNEEKLALGERLALFQHLPCLFLVRHLLFYKATESKMMMSHNHTMEFVKEQMRQAEKRGEDVENFCKSYRRKVGKDLDENALLFIVRDLFIAGTEPSSAILSWATIYMVNYPHVQKQVQEELQQAVGSGRQVTLDHKPRTPYTEAVIQEIQRYTVLVPLAVPHMVMEDTTLSGYYLPKGTTVFANLWSVLRDPQIWADPDIFRPERFLDDEGALIHRPELILFSLGKRMCLGERMARQNLYLFFSNILLNFKVRAPHGADRVSEDSLTVITRIPLSCQIVFERNS